ncbi:O-unit flippase-like protein [Sphingomonas sp. OV641]|uniref:O-unit flippase-like protein n=1 Tax=Sphingomonas sp. OV641 TaxID=1881068 RepID=UPI000833E6DE|nr:O-unit flippase-like protein [Sphingomonas sp. OV641]
MIVHIRRHRALAIGMTAQVIQFGSALALVPFMVTRFSASTVGLWYIFATMQTLALVCDFGFQPSFTRGIALALSGARQLEKKGLGEAVPADQPPNYRLAAEAVAAARRFYRWLAVGVMLLLLLAGLPYITALARQGDVSVTSVQIAWVIQCCAIGLTLSFLWITPVLMGSGRVEQNYLYIIANRATFSLAGIAVLMLGGDLIALTATLVATQVFARLLAQRLMRGVLGPEDSRLVDRSAARHLLRTLAPNAGRMGAVAIGGFLVTRFSLFAISSFVGVAIGGVYALSLQLLMALCAAAQLPMQVAMPRLIAARVAHDKAALRLSFNGAMIAFALIYVLGAAFILFVMPVFLEMIGSNLSLLPLPTLALLAFIVLLEGFHSNAAFFITTANNVPFLRPAVLSGAAVAAGALLLGWSGAGITAIVLWQGTVQLAYNNWRWPLMAWREIART